MCRALRPGHAIALALWRLAGTTAYRCGMPTCWCDLARTPSPHPRCFASGPHHHPSSASPPLLGPVAAPRPPLLLCCPRTRTGAQTKTTNSRTNPLDVYWDQLMELEQLYHSKTRPTLDRSKELGGGAVDWHKAAFRHANSRSPVIFDSWRRTIALGGARPPLDAKAAARWALLRCGVRLPAPRARG